MQTVAVARNAMATRFEILLHGESAPALRAAGEEALDEVERLENQLSIYRPSSDVSRINARAGSAPVRVEPSLFRLLQHARKLSQETEMTFDITVGPLVRCWGFMGGSGHVPDPQELAAARECIGMDLVLFDEGAFTVEFARRGVMLDLGSIGKGHALEKAAEVLREAGVNSALLHGGTSTIYALGSPPGADAWTIALQRPDAADLRANLTNSPPISSPELSTPPLALVPLRDEALSVSAVWGKSFQIGDATFGHVLDPRTGQPVSNTLMAAVVLPSATETDALSTALLTLGRDGLHRITNLREEIRTLLVTRQSGAPGFLAVSNGIALLL